MFNFFSRNKNESPTELCFDTDIHCHIIPGVDDGSRNVETSVTLIEQMQQWGIKQIIASPHVTQYTFENDLSTITPAIEKLKAELDARGNSLKLSHAAEYRIDELFMHRLEKGDVMLLPNNYILIENSFIQEPWNIDQLIFDLQVKGFRPILAHPERYSYYYTRKNRYSELHNAGLLFQINLLSLAGEYGKGERKFAEYLMEQGLVDFIGTDIHRQAHIDTINKYLTTKLAHSDMDTLSKTVLNNQAFS
ncbi:MAG: hypothetical protein J1F05_04050 [Muribaculaceae bacterium]|nr:hypothetical protein [Muribaculaceae bacterium]